MRVDKETVVGYDFLIVAVWTPRPERARLRGGHLDRTIGIKIADGTFFPVLEDGYYGDKRLVLTTVRDNQAEVHVDLYQGSAESGIQGSRYIGSLIIENIRPGPKGGADIEVVLGVNREGNLNVSATDRSTGEEQSLSVSLRAMEEEAEFEVPDFDLQSPPPEPEPEVTPVSSAARAMPTRATSHIEPREETVEPRRSIVGILSVAVLAIVAIAVAAFFVVRAIGARRPVATPVPTMQPSAEASAEPTAEASAEPMAEASAEPMATPQTAQALGERGIRYRIKWGDTLWDLSATFYRDPWLYPRIAKANNIPNPDLIFAETTIFIPER